MSVRSTLVLMRLAILFFLAASPMAAMLVNLYPALVVPIVLFGAVIVGTPVGLVLGRAMQRGLEEDFAARYRRLEPAFVLAAGASQLALIVPAAGRGGLGFLGVVIAAGGLSAAGWLLLKAAPAGGGRGARLFAPGDPGRRFD